MAGESKADDITLALVADRLDRLTVAVQENNTLLREQIAAECKARQEDHDRLITLEPRVEGLEGDVKELSNAVSSRTNAFVGTVLTLASTLLAHVGLGLGKP
jgi:hypothetical protein